MKYTYCLIASWVVWPAILWVTGFEPFQRGLAAGICLMLSLACTAIIALAYHEERIDAS